MLYLGDYKFLKNNEIVEIKNYENCILNEKIYDLLYNISLYDYIIFDSYISIKCFFEKIRDLKLDIRNFFGVSFLTINNIEKYLIDYNIYADEKFVHLDDFIKHFILGKLTFKSVALFSNYENYELKDLFKIENISLLDIRTHKDICINFDEPVSFISTESERDFYKIYKSGCKL